MCAEQLATKNRSESCRTLDVGCGKYKIPGAIGIDRSSGPGVDVLYDLDEYPWPFPDSSFDRVVCRHVLAHLQNVVRAIEELHRITCPGGLVEIVTPHFSSDNAFTDITSRWFFGYRSMDYFSANRNCRYRYSQKEFRLKQVRISFRQARVFEGERRKFNPFALIGLEWLVNAFPRPYEHFCAFLLRANEVYFELEVLKR